MYGVTTTKLESQCTAVDKMYGNSALHSEMFMLIVCYSMHFMGTALISGEVKNQIFTKKFNPLKTKRICFI
jgi:hypothetical protein